MHQGPMGVQLRSSLHPHPSPLLGRLQGQKQDTLQGVDVAERLKPSPHESYTSKLDIGT
jgi:hypothetical protein